jgi:hypothetical protein
MTHNQWRTDGQSYKQIDNYLFYFVFTNYFYGLFNSVSGLYTYITLNGRMIKEGRFGKEVMEAAVAFLKSSKSGKPQQG